MKEGFTKPDTDHRPVETRKTKVTLLEKWTKGGLEKRKLLASMDRMPLHLPLNEAIKALPPFLRPSKELAAEARDYLLLISSMVPKHGPELSFESEVRELLREVPKNLPTHNHPPRPTHKDWAMKLLLSPSMAGCLGAATAAYFALKWAIHP
jgi:hypothetical protein